MSRPASILAFRNGSIGNTLVAVPALRALRRHHPASTLSVVVDPVGYELLERCPWIDRLLIYDKRGKDRGLRGFGRLAADLRALRPTHAVLFKRFFRNGLLAFLSGAKVRAGFLTEGRAPFLNLTIPYEEFISVVELNMKLAALLGASSSDRSLEVFLTPEDRGSAERIAAERGARSSFDVVAHYGGLTTPPSFLPPERFGELLSRMVPREGRAFLIGSGARERDWAGRVQSSAPRTGLLLDLPLRVTAALIEQAAFFVGFNSGPAHIASAVRTPGLVLFRPGPGVEAEIVKWCPPVPHVEPLVPPMETDGPAWARFLEGAARAAEKLARRPVAHASS